MLKEDWKVKSDLRRALICLEIAMSATAHVRTYSGGGERILFEM